MKDSAARLEFERAARLRDRLTAVRKVIEKQTMVTERPEDLDVIGLVDDELEAAVQVFYVRRGRVVGRKGFVLDKVEDVTPTELVGIVLQHMYGSPGPLGVPREVLVPDAAGGSGDLRGVARRPPGHAASPCACRNGATSARCRPPSPGTRPRSSTVTG